MKKGGTFLLIGMTLVFVGFALGMLVGRSTNQNTVVIQTAAPAPTTGTESASPTGATVQSHLININTAPVALLDTLPGIGPVLAQRIVDYRTENGDFKDIYQLSNVEGIGNETLLRLLDLITVEESQ